MADRPPPNRYSVVERGGRLVVIDRQTGQTPLTAAERMDLHDRQMGVEAIRPAKASSAPDMSAAARAESGLSARPAPGPQPAAQAATPPAADAGKARMAAAIANMNNKRPWSEPAKRSAQIAQRPQPQPQPQASGARKTIVTAKWWDAKGPRSIELGPRGQQKLSGGFVTLFFVAVILAIVLLVISPIALFVAAFLLFRWGGNALGPVGAGIIDKALAEKG